MVASNEDCAHEAADYVDHRPERFIAMAKEFENHARFTKAAHIDKYILEIDEEELIRRVQMAKDHKGIRCPEDEEIVGDAK